MRTTGAAGRRQPHARRRWQAALAIGVALAFVSSVTVASAAFVATTANASNSFGAAASFPDYPTAVLADSPLFYHRLDDAAGSTTAGDSSGNGRTGVYGADTATGSTFLAPFDEGSGSTVKDLSGVASPHDLTGATLAWATGRAGTAGSFNGTSSYAASSGAVVTTNAGFSVSAWVYLSATGSNRTAVSQNGTNVSGFFLQYDHASTRWRWTMPQSDSTAASGDVVLSTAVAATNTWTHLLGTFDPTADQLKLYVNGTLQGTTTRTAAWSATGNLEIGAARNAGRVDYWSGRVDDVRTYAGVLGQNQATELANGITGGPSTSYDFGENTGTTTYDDSGNTNTGTFGSGASWTTGKVGTGVALNGTANAYVAGTVPAVDTSTSFTISAWAYLTALPGVNKVIVSQTGTTVAGFVLLVGSDGKWGWSMPQTDTAVPTYDWVASTSTAALNTWTHLVGVYDSTAAAGQHLKLYVNAGTPTVAGHTTTWNATGALQVGRALYNSAYTDHYPSRIDDVRTYRRALTATEISALYNGGNSTTDTLGHTALGQPGALQGAQQGQQNSTSAAYSDRGPSYNPTRSAGPATWSAECWFKSSHNAGTIIDFGSTGDGNSGSYSRKIHLSTTGVVTFGTDSAVTNMVQSAPGYLDGQWHHVVATFSVATGLALYLDGNLVGTTSYAGYPTSSGVWRWGGQTHNAAWPSPDYFTGRIDEVAVYGTVLSAQQVARHYHANH